MYRSTDIIIKWPREAVITILRIRGNNEQNISPKYQHGSMSFIPCTGMRISPAIRSATARERISTLVGVWSCLKCEIETITNKFRNTVNTDDTETKMYTTMYSASGLIILVQDKLLSEKQYWIVRFSVFVTPQLDISMMDLSWRVDSVWGYLPLIWLSFILLETLGDYLTYSEVWIFSHPPSNLIFIVLNSDIHKPIRPYLIYIPVMFLYVNTQLILSHFLM